MSKQIDLKNRVLAQKLIDDFQERGRNSQEDWLITHDDFLNYLNKELFEYLETDYSGLIKILEALKMHGVIFQYECLDTKGAIKKSKLENYRTTGFSVDRIPKHGECVIRVTGDFIKSTEAYLASSRSSATEIETSAGLILYLDQNGNLWHGNKSENCYSMKKSSGRFFIFKYLVDNQGYQDTEIITSKLNAKFPKQKKSQNVRTEIGKMRTLISNKLDIDDLILTGNNDNGYGLSSKYKIVWQK